MASREAITEYIASLAGVEVLIASQENGSPEVAWGDAFFTYDPEHKGQKFPFATIGGQDYGDFDNASNLNRPGVFRLNVGVSKVTFGSLFKPGAEFDFTALDQLMPHPVYGRSAPWISWSRIIGIRDAAVPPRHWRTAWEDADTPRSFVNVCWTSFQSRPQVNRKAPHLIVSQAERGLLRDPL